MEPADAERDSGLIRRFVDRHFGLRGTLRLHRHAIGLDLLRAPANIVMAPVFLVSRLLSLLLHALRFRSAARVLAGRRFQFRLATGKALDRAIREDILRPRSAASPSPAAERAIADYLAVRSAVAEICTTVVVVGLSFAVFRTVTPGVLSLAPLVSDRAAQTRAVDAFPLGRGLGSVWYGAFPSEVAPWFVLAVALALVAAASVLSTFIGILADPLQSALGIHRRRLHRLLATIDAADGRPPALAREHILARFADIADAGVALVRWLLP
ncbi:hypothetical protein HKCCE2091_02665 [Rhodobacterales bacterium HKCCE2091]|nr:hypothetical protein [Rhodobacterales bacterium HKCCE2091]